MYKAKTIIPGYKLGLEKGTSYIAVPENVAKKGNSVAYKGKSMTITKDPESYQTFKDKFKPNEFYRLNYYKWVPDEK